MLKIPKDNKEVFVIHNKFVIGEGMRETMEFIADVYPCGVTEYCGKPLGCLACRYYMKGGKGKA